MTAALYAILRTPFAGPWRRFSDPRRVLIARDVDDVQRVLRAGGFQARDAMQLQQHYQGRPHGLLIIDYQDLDALHRVHVRLPESIALRSQASFEVSRRQGPFPGTMISSSIVPAYRQ